MISVTDLRAGTTFEEDQQLFQVLSYEHIKMGRGSANIKVKVRNLRTGSITDKSFISGAKINDIQLTKKQLQFLYKDSNTAYFMDPTSFEQTSIPLELLPENQFLKEGEMATVSFFDNEPLSLNLPPKMEFTVVETGPGEKGNSATNIYKDATLENGIRVKVPLFIKIGDRILIDTRTLNYHEKANTH